MSHSKTVVDQVSDDLRDGFLGAFCSSRLKMFLKWEFFPCGGSDWSAQWVLTPRLGKLSAKGCDPGHWNQMRWNQALLEEGGNTKQR